MAANAKVILELVAENRKMLAGIAEAVKQTEKLDKGAQTAGKSFGNMGGILKGLAGVFSVTAATFAAKEIIQAATAHEKAVNKVSDALAKVGANVGPAAIKSIEEFATNVQKATGISSEVFIELQAKATNFGAKSTEMSQKFAQAAIETAAATGQGADEIIKKLGETTRGEVGELGKLVPALKNLTKEQLIAGDAAKLLLDRYSGSSASSMGAFSFQVNQVYLAFKDMAVALGEVITKNDGIQKLVSAFGRIFQNLADAINKNADSITGAIDNILNKIFTLVEWLGRVEKFSATVLGDKEGAAKAQQVIDGAQIFKDRMSAEELAKFDERTPEQKQAAAKVGAVFSGGPTGGKGGDPNKVATIYGQDGFVGPGKPSQQAIDEAFANWAKANQGPQIPPDVLKQRQDQSAANAANIQAQKAQGAQAVNAGLGGVSSILSGNAAGAVAGIAGMGADMLLPGIGPGVSAIVAELAKGPEHVKAMINQFVDALPEVLANIVEAIPVVIETLIDRLPDIIVALAENMPRIAVALAKALSDPKLMFLIVQGIVKGLSQVISEELGRWGQALEPLWNSIYEFFAGFFNAIGELGFSDLGEKIGDFFSGFGDKIGDLGNAIWDGITKAFDDVIGWIADGFNWLADGIMGIFKWLGDMINSLTGGGGGSGGYIGQVGKKLGFATGGYVRGMGTGDSVPAMLTPGELVVDRETGPQLRSFLSNQGNQEAILMEMVALLRQPMTIQTTAEVDKRAFANILLTMSRQNQRLTA